MGYIGKVPSAIALTSSDITNDIINSDKISDNSISEEHIDNTAITGHSAITSLADTDKFLVSDASDSNNLKYVEKQYLPSGGLVAIGQVDSGGNVGSITLDNKFSTTYKNYIIIVDKMIPATDGANIIFRLRDDTPSSISDSNYDYNTRAWRSSDNTLYLAANDNVSAVNFSDGGVSNTSSRLGFRMVLHIQDPFTSTVKTSGHGTLMFVNTGGVSLGGYTHFYYKNNASPRGVEFYANTGNVNGRIKIYGVVDS